MTTEAVRLSDEMNGDELQSVQCAKTWSCFELTEEKFSKTNECNNDDSPFVIWVNWHDNDKYTIALIACSAHFVLFFEFHGFDFSANGVTRWSFACFYTFNQCKHIWCDDFFQVCIFFWLNVETQNEEHTLAFWNEHWAVKAWARCACKFP